MNAQKISLKQYYDVEYHFPLHYKMLFLIKVL